MLEVLKELWDFLKVRKKYWLLPIIIVMLLMSLLIIFGGATGTAPFIYTIF